MKTAVRYFLSTLALLLTILLVVILLFLVQQGESGEVKRGSVVVWEELTGEMVPEKEYPLQAFRAVVIKSREVKLEEAVKKGDRLMVLEAGGKEVIVYAHRDGIVSFLNQGENLGAGEILLRLADKDSFLGQLTLSLESRIGRGDPAQLKYQGQEVAAEVIKIEKRESGESKLARLKLKAALPIFASVQVQVVTAFKKEVLLVPNKALFQEQNQDFVWRKSALGKKRQVVEVGLRGNEYSEILSGLEEKEEILF